MIGATLSAARQQTAWRLPAAGSALWPALAIAFALLAQMVIATQRAINWDEFYHYSQIHLFLRGELTAPLQTLPARLFAWAAALPGTGVDHILAIRLVMFACLAAAAASTYLIAERFSARPTALLCALLYLSAGFVLQHGSSFRADPMAAALLTASLAIMLRSRLGPAAVLMASLLVAIAFMVTIKSVLYAPAFAGIAWLRWSEAGFARATLLRLAALLCGVVVLFALLFWWHGLSLGQPAASAAATAGGAASGSAQKMFALGGLPYYHHIAQAALLAPVLALCALLAPVALWKSREPAGRRVAIAGLWLPLVSLAVYHNTAPYFYVFLLPPIAAACAASLPLLQQRYSVAALAGILALNAGVVLAIEEDGPIEKQRALLQAADTIFPQPVAYFDFPGMLGKHSKANAFMTPWGAENYRERGYGGTMREAMEKRVVPLVVENDPMFSQVLRSNGPAPQFLPADATALRENFVHFWGPFWVAGRRVRAEDGIATSEFLVPGPYTAEGRLELDGRTVESGQVVTLERGQHKLRALDASAALVWGEHLEPPPLPAPAAPYWTIF